jgi:hypothetical protein
MQKSEGHVEFIDGYEYFQDDDRLYRADVARPLVAGKRQGRFVTAGSGIAFALQIARIAVAERKRMNPRSGR